eukprot:252497_1
MSLLLLLFSAIYCIHSKPISVRETLFGAQNNINRIDATTSLDIKFSDNTYTKYSLTLNGNTWLNSGDTQYRTNGNWAKLSLDKTDTTTGSNIYGSFSDLNIHWNNGEFIETIRIYKNSPDIIQFIQQFPNGLKKSSTGNADDIISSLPSFVLDNKNLGYAHWSGNMAGSGTQYGKFEGSPSLSGGRDQTGPIVIFNPEMTNALVISALTNHMAMSDHTTTNSNKQKEIQWGIIGNVDQVTAGFNASFIIVTNPNGGGVNRAMRAWGDRQLQYYGKKRGNAHERDYTLQYLGYSTDNGAYYYYETEPNKNYQQTMIDLKSYHDQLNIPTKWVLLDSWWYFKGENSGVKNWTARPDIFPGGMQAVYQATKWKIQAHNRFWALDNVYSDNIPHQTEVGNYDFTWSDKSALPLTTSFWKHLFDINADWGLITYEQDWLSTSEDQIPLLWNSTTFGRDWLMQMGTQAYAHNLSIQYCMDYPRHLMTSVELPAVTQARASGDYHPGNNQWQVGVTAIFTSAIDIAPSKDSYWSQPNPQSGHYSAGTHEPYNRLQSAVLSLSNGPVTFADRIGYSDAKLIMRCCSTNGLVLRPDTSATMIDSYFRYRTGFQNATQMSSGEIWSTYSVISKFKYWYVFGVSLNNALKIYPSDINYDLVGDTNDNWLYYEANDTSTFGKFNYENSLEIKSCKEYNFQLYTLIPIDTYGKDEWYLAGEIDKWITVSAQRFLSISRGSNNDISVSIQGEVGETVNVAFVNGSSMKQQVVPCKIGSSGKMTVKMPQASCS